MRMVTLYRKSIYDLHYININDTLLGIVRHATYTSKSGHSKTCYLPAEARKDLGVILLKELPALKTYKDTG